MSNLFNKWKWVCVTITDANGIDGPHRAYDVSDIKHIVTQAVADSEFSVDITITDPESAGDPEAENARLKTRFTYITWTPEHGASIANVVEYHCDSTGAPIIDNALDNKYCEHVSDGLSTIVKEMLNYYIDESPLHSIHIARLKVDELLFYVADNIRTERDAYIYYGRDGEVTILQRDYNKRFKK